MEPTSMIHDLVRNGRISPEGGARMLKLRGEILFRRERSQRSFAIHVVAFFGVLVLALLGIRRDNA